MQSVNSTSCIDYISKGDNITKIITHKPQIDLAKTIKESYGHITERSEEFQASKAVSTQPPSCSSHPLGSTPNAWLGFTFRLTCLLVAICLPLSQACYPVYSPVFKVLASFWWSQRGAIAQTPKTVNLTRAGVRARIALPSLGLSPGLQGHLVAPGTNQFWRLWKYWNKNLGYCTKKGGRRE